jgi:hypothetical protein
MGSNEGAETVKERRKMILEFGKYKGKNIEEVAQADPGYIHWLAEEAWDADVREAAREALKATPQAQPDIDTPLTFGKWSGWSPAELAQAGETGRDYLDWGASHLDNPTWCRRFSAALSAYTADNIDVDLAARALQKDAPDLGPEEAQRVAHEEKRQATRDTQALHQFNRAKAKLRDDLEELGVGSPQARTAIADWAARGGMDYLDQMVKRGQLRFERIARADVAEAVARFEERMGEIRWV